MKEKWPGTPPRPFNSEDSFRTTYFGNTDPASRPGKEPRPQTNTASSFNNFFGFPNFFGSNSHPSDQNTPRRRPSTPFPKPQPGNTEPFPDYSGSWFPNQSPSSNSQFNSHTTPHAPFTPPFANSTSQAQSPFAGPASNNPFQTSSNVNSTNRWARVDEDVDMTGKADDHSGWAADDVDMMDTI